jgi:NAD+ synthase
MQHLSIALAQANFTVGDIRGNTEKIWQYHAQAGEQNADLIIFPELAITGYPPEDLLHRESFRHFAVRALESLIPLTKDGPAMIIGGLWLDREQLHNAVFLIDDGKIIIEQLKHVLPNYGVFDEKRLFQKGELPNVVEWRSIKLGLMVCEDMWEVSVPQYLAEQGAELLITINASPYEMGKAKRRKAVAKVIAAKYAIPQVYLNLIGGQDELVFDGKSFVMNASGEMASYLPAFEESLAITQWEKTESWQCINGPIEQGLDDSETIYKAMVLGLHDYVEKNSFKGVILGLSGGIDSGLTAAVAVDALGAARVHAVLMPSPYTSCESIEDAEELAKNLGIQLDNISIAPAMDTLNGMLAPIFKGRPTDTTEENLQSRLRGNILMAISNKLGLMLLTTGNKSEMSVGYATLYGDMCGGYSVLKDVYKTTLFKLSHWRNRNGEVIPERMITKPPSAELKADQKDEDSLPPYDVLDAILLQMIEYQQSVDAIVAQGFEREVVEFISKMLYTAEFKRRQAPPGVKITEMSFGRDRRYPITNKFKDLKNRI